MGLFIKTGETNMKQAIILSGLIATSPLTACADSEEFDGAALAMVQEEFVSETRLGLTLIPNTCEKPKDWDYRKINGERRDLFGQKLYLYHFVASAKLPAGMHWDGSGQGTFHCNHPQLPALPKDAMGVMQGTVWFKWTDNGWMADAIKNRKRGYCVDAASGEDCSKRLGWH